VIRTRGARSAKCILQVLSCAGGRSPSTLRSVTAKRMNHCGGIYLSDTLHETIAEAPTVRGVVGGEAVLPHTRYSLMEVRHHAGIIIYMVEGTYQQRSNQARAQVGHLCGQSISARRTEVAMLTVL
jgi:hypothetical protein